jgi:hypothetical protein
LAGQAHKKLFQDFAKILARGSVSVEERTKLMPRFFEVRDLLFKQTEASNVFISKLASLIK